MFRVFYFLIMVCLLACSTAYAAKDAIVLSWLPPSPPTNALYYSVWSTPNLGKPFTLLENVTNSTQYIYYTSNAPMKFFQVTANTYVYGISTNPSVTLMWDYTCNGTSQDVTGYRVYMGTASRSYTNAVPIFECTNRSGTISNLTTGVMYYFSATAIDTYGIESDYSDEVTHTASFWVTNWQGHVPVYLSINK